jgi:hypothetical protein
MATSLTNKQGGSIWTLRQAKSLNALGAEVETAIDGVANSQATAADFTIGTEAANVINVAVELQDGDGTAVSSLQGVNVFLSDASTGIGLAATAPDGGWAIGTDGAILGAHDANKSAWVQTEADGTFDLDITESAGATWYMVVQLPDGKQVVSGAITFAA